tara:strand:+ start:393 stop:1358 length:966 start_codon:yes stop_codon:yes gene_type:complete
MKEESAAILAAAERLNNNQVEKILLLIEECYENKKKLVLTGVGKSGIVARKLAATFTSIGLNSIYLNPLDALHGDLGIVNRNDICILLSNSGETQELIQLIPHLKNKGSTQIGILGSLNSTLANQSDLFLDASVDKEVCPLNLAPTASTTVAMAIGDALAVVWMEKRGISRQDFAVNHPAGKLGRELTLRVLDLMKPCNQLNPLFRDSSLFEVITELTRGGIGGCLIKEISTNDKLIGLITDGDLRRALKNYEQNMWITLVAEEIMTKDPIVIGSNKFAIEALELMEKNRKKPISLLPVIDNNSEFIGILRLHDLIQAGLS